MEGVSLPFIVSLIVQSSFVCGGFLFLFLLKSKKIADKFLIGYLFLSLIILGLNQFEYNELPKVITNTLFWLLGPFLYFYIQTFYGQKIKAIFWHFVPFLVVLSTSLFYIGTFQISRFWAGAHLIIYLLIAIITVFKRSEQKGINLFDNPGSRLIWFRNFILYQVLIFLYLVFFAFANGILQSIMVDVFLSLNIYFVLFQIIKESSFFNDIPLGQKYAKSSLTADQKSAIVLKLEILMNDENYFANKSASLSDLAKQLNTSTHNLSQVLNENQKRSFFDMISMYRIREAKKLLKHPDYDFKKVEEIADSVGYNSKSAFNTAFKKQTGITPSEFKQGKYVLTYGDEQLAHRELNRFIKYTRTFGQALNNTGMIRNFIKIFSRNMKRNKIFSFLNLFGLTLGFTSSMLIYLFINDELSYDKYLDNSENIYRVYWESEASQTRTPHPMAQAMANDFPEVISAVSISPWYGSGLSKQKVTIINKENNIKFEEPDFYFVDSTFFDVFEYKILQGNTEDPLKQPNGVIITQEMATKYFGDSDPIGKNLTIGEGSNSLAVIAVVETPPENAHFHFNFLYSYVNLKNSFENNPWMKWEDFGHFNYFKLAENVDYKVVESKIPKWIVSYLGWSADRVEGLFNEDYSFRLIPIQDIHLKSHLRWELEVNGNILYVYILFGTLIFILLIASINYINLTTAKSMERAKEIGVKKTLGAKKSMLSFQFLTESAMVCLLAYGLALILAILLIPEFNSLNNKDFSVNALFNFSFIIKTSLLALMIGLLSGLYPALTMSAIDPTEILKGKFSTSGRGNRLRSFLVIVQFCISAILICASLIVMNQIDFMKSKDLGFDKNHLISIPINTSIVRSKIETIQSELEAINGVIKVSTISNVPGSQFNQNPIFWEENPENLVDASEMFVDYDVLDVLKIELVSGRNFDRTFSVETSGSTFIINEAAVSSLNLTNPVGTTLGWNVFDTTRYGKVIGVVKDFHYKSLHSTVQPLLIQINTQNFNKVIVKIEEQNISQTLQSIEQLYASFDSEFVFDFNFLDQQIDDLYQSEIRTLEIFSLFSIIALILACLGLLGIAIATLNQKIKEVGIRKILGASSTQITNMMLFNFLKLIIIAATIGLPTAHFLMQKWIEEFPYQAQIGIFPFIISIAVLLLVAISSVSIVVLKIAFSNPINALRYE